MNTTRAFDRLAPDYDTLASGELFRLLRARTHRAFARVLSPGWRVLEIGCGTGLDTAFLASFGVEVVACDPAVEMVTRAARRLAHDGLSARATVMPCGLQDVQEYLEVLAPDEPFDAVISNFGALNCVCHLAPLGALVRRHLRPGGVVLLGVMTRLCAVEAAYFMMKRRPCLACRRLGTGGVAVPVAGVDVFTFYHRVRDVRHALGADLRLDHIEGIGVVVPPPYLEPRWRSLPGRVRSTLDAIDAVIAHWPLFNRIGDHVLLQFRKVTYA